jgi:hypothetical protein
MKFCAGLLLILVLCGCWSRPCCVVDSIRIPCRAEGTDTESWRIATSICRSLETAGLEAQRAYVDGTKLTLNLTPRSGRQLSVDTSVLKQSVADFLSMLSREAGANEVSVEVFSGDILLATGKTSESGRSEVMIQE